MNGEQKFALLSEIVKKDPHSVSKFLKQELESTERIKLAQIESDKQIKLAKEENRSKEELAKIEANTKIHLVNIDRQKNYDDQNFKYITAIELEEIAYKIEFDKNRTSIEIKNIESRIDYNRLDFNHRSYMAQLNYNYECNLLQFNFNQSVMQNNYSTFNHSIDSLPKNKRLEFINSSSSQYPYQSTQPLTYYNNQVPYLN